MYFHHDSSSSFLCSSRLRSSSLPPLLLVSSFQLINVLQAYEINDWVGHAIKGYNNTLPKLFTTMLPFSPLSLLFGLVGALSQKLSVASLSSLVSPIQKAYIKCSPRILSIIPGAIHNCTCNAMFKYQNEIVGYVETAKNEMNGEFTRFM